MTPSVSNSQGNTYTRDRGLRGAERPTLSGQASSMWATPHGLGGIDKTGKVGGGGEFAAMVERTCAKWPTPTAQDSEQAGGKGLIERRGSHTLNSAATSAWPTPASRDYRSPNAESLEDRGGGNKGEQLPNFVAHHFSLPQAQPTTVGQESSPPRRTSLLRLNPVFGEWLMGWRLQWTKAEPNASSASATASWRCRLHLHLSCLLDEQASPERLAA